ncbi:MAG: HD-GYP domain-containing protein [Casimicrobium sp.]
MPTKSQPPRTIHIELEGLVSMLEMAADFHYDADALVDNIADIEKVRLPSLINSQTAESLDWIVRIGNCVARLTCDDVAEAQSRVLEAIAFSFIPRGRAQQGLPYGRAAVYVARMHGYSALERKALSTLAALSNDGGMPAKGVEYAVMAAQLASEIGESLGLAGSLGNLSSSLKALGMYRETVAIALRVVELSRGEPRLKGVVAQAYGNMSMAAYALLDYQLGVGHGLKAAEELQAPGSLSEANNLLGILGSTIKNMIALNMRVQARDRLEYMKRIASAVPNGVRMQLNVSLAEALCEISEGHTAVGITRLLGLLDQTRTLPGLYLDNLEFLIRAYGAANNLPAMARCTSQLVEQIMQAHTRSTSSYLALVGVETQTLQPGKLDAYPLTRAVVFKRPMPTLEPAPSAEAPESIAQEHFENLVVTAELREDASGRHAYRVGRMSALIAAELGYNPQFCEEVERASRLHDIGKLAIRDAIVNKPGKFTPLEREEMQRHTTYGARLLSVDVAGTGIARQIALYHHEHWDGNGYPEGLSGTTIPEPARIAAVADVFDALTHRRVYKEPWEIDLAIEEIVRLSNTQFEPRVVDAFMKVIEKLRQTNPDNVDDQLVPAAPSAMLRSRDAVLSLIDKIPLPWEQPAEAEMVR